MKHFSLRHFLILIITLLVGGPVIVSAASDTENTTINASLGSTITLASSGTVNISLTPTASGSMSSSDDTVEVATNNATGYTLTLANGDGNTNLVNGGNTIAADSGTQASPSSSLTNNRWGYRIDGLGGFGSGPTSAEVDESSSAYSWAGIPASSAPNTIRTTNAALGSSITTVWFGVKADTSKPNGTYSDTVTYTATTNP